MFYGDDIGSIFPCVYCLLTPGKVAHFRNPKMRNCFHGVLGSLETKPLLSLAVSGPFM